MIQLRGEKMNLQKRDCKIKMKLVPYGSGWTDFYVNFDNEELYFTITSAFGDNFSSLIEALYYLHPKQNDPYDNMDIEYYDGVIDIIDNEYKVVKIVKQYDNAPAIIRPIPYKATFNWQEEGTSSEWTLTREPTEDEDFDLQIDISVYREEEKRYSYKVRYKELCYAVAKTCTKVLKSHGIYGYHYSTYEDDINLRHLLFIKAVALDSLEVRELTDMGDELGESTCFEKELELLLFDM